MKVFQKITSLFLLLALIFSLAACGKKAETPTPTQASTETVAPTQAPTEPTKPAETPTEAPTAEPTEAPTAADNIIYGDANCDEAVTMADAAAIFQSLGNPDKYALSEQGRVNADCSNTGDGVTPADGLAVQKLTAGLIDSLPEITKENL